jgi:hypothetical protein
MAHAKIISVGGGDVVGGASFGSGARGASTTGALYLESSNSVMTVL